MQFIQHKTPPRNSHRALMGQSERGLWMSATILEGMALHRRYPVFDLVRIGVVMQMRGYGIAEETIARHVDALKRQVKSSGHYEWLMVLRPYGANSEGGQEATAANDAEALFFAKDNWDKIEHELGRTLQAFCFSIVDVGTIHRYVSFQVAGL